MDPEPTNLLLNFLDNINIWFIVSLIALLLLLVISALISGSEVAYFSLSPTTLNKVSESKNNKEKVVVELLEKPKKLLATILIANNFINILIVLLFAFIGEFIFAGITSDIIKFLIEVVLVTFLILLFGEVLPKVYATRNALKFASIMAYPLKVVSFLLTFISVPLRGLTNVIENNLRQKQSSISVENLSQALELTSNEATTTDEHKILQGIVNFGNTETCQIMTPRIDIFAISIDEPFEKVIANIVKKGFSRNIVYGDNIDDVVGVLYAKDLLPHLNKKVFQWNKILREPYFVPENKKLDDLLKEFQEKKNHLAVVVDEYGGTSGIITLEDVIEEIVGDINDEFDEDDISYSKLDANNYLFEGKTNLKDFCRVLEIEDDIDFEENKGEAETIAGFILEISGRFPKKREVINFLNYSFKIESVDRRRIKQVKVTIKR
ncbi:gliding motility-associated protein GldE [Lutibacter sp. TH_r2]|uniref:gliding motility-associated protein GldE n=1 Tax=Lutibacter sp. TH_r2 TaxID=3082083 RepID=UPI002954F6CD|nr:gliding motility-associated protein GldE [Lutibacter sp. TH_r2]MDV7186277.1 gliding motility-associated protein GldE [Lutibacter sp. TH_r2]